MLLLDGRDDDDASRPAPRLLSPARCAPLPITTEEALRTGRFFAGISLFVKPRPLYDPGSQSSLLLYRFVPRTDHFGEPTRAYRPLRSRLRVSRLSPDAFR